MWKDFVDAFGHTFQAIHNFQRAQIWVEELKTWVVWHERRAQQRLYLTVVAVGCLCFLAGIVIGKFLEAG